MWQIISVFCETKNITGIKRMATYKLSHDEFLNIKPPELVSYGLDVISTIYDSGVKLNVKEIRKCVDDCDPIAYWCDNL